MATEIEIIQLTYMLDEDIDPASSSARSVAEKIAKTLGRRLEKRYPYWKPRVVVKTIRRGSTLVELAVWVAVFSAIRTFIIDYPDLRAGIIAIAQDLKHIYSWARSLFPEKLSIRLVKSEEKPPLTVVGELGALGVPREEQGVNTGTASYRASATHARAARQRNPRRS
jgi:hypothetical protein